MTPIGTATTPDLANAAGPSGLIPGAADDNLSTTRGRTGASGTYPDSEYRTMRTRTLGTGPFRSVMPLVDGLLEELWRAGTGNGEEEDGAGKGEDKAEGDGNAAGGGERGTHEGEEVEGRRPRRAGGEAVGVKVSWLEYISCLCVGPSYVRDPPPLPIRSSVDLPASSLLVALPSDASCLFMLGNASSRFNDRSNRL